MNRHESQATMARLFELYRKIPSYRHHGLSTKELHEALAQEGYIVSKRTVERDLKVLQDLVELDCERKPEGNVWKQANLNADLQPTMQPTEALFLVLAEKFLLRTLPPDSQKSLEVRLSKAHKTISKANALEQWQGKLHVISGQVPYHNDELVAQWRQTIYQAVLSELQINLKYKKLNTETATEYQLNPLAIIVREHSHYLVATKLETPDKPQLFNFMRMVDAELTYLPVEKAKTFRLEDYIDSNPTGWILSEEVQHVTLRVRWFAYDWLLHNKLHPNQELKKLDDEWYQLRFSGLITYDLVGWILRFSTDVVVDGSSLLVNEIKNRLASMAESYRF